MHFKTTLLPIAGAIALTFLAGAAHAQETVIRLGHVAPMSGGQAHYGRDNANGAIMAVEELNAKGITIGGRKAKFVLLAEDDAADPKQGPAAAQKLVDAKVNGVIGLLNSGTTIPASKIYNDAGIPQISPSAAGPGGARRGGRAAGRGGAGGGQLGGTLGKYAVDTLKS